MSCRGSAWCPQCRQVITDSICMCAGVCDIHGQVCTPIVPDGVHDVRRTTCKESHSKVEYLRGWEIGFMGGRPSGGDIVWEWMTREPGHPTKSASEVWWDDFLQQAKPILMARLVKTNYLTEPIIEIHGADGGGI